MKKDIKGLTVVGFKQNETSVLCKVYLTAYDASFLCEKNSKGEYKNTGFRKFFVDVFSEELERVLHQ